MLTQKRQLQIIVVPRVGLEPTRCRHHRILNPARLPFRHPGNRRTVYTNRI